MQDLEHGGRASYTTTPDTLTSFRQLYELLLDYEFVSYAKGLSDEWFPYDDTLAVRRSDSLWPLDERQLVRVSDLDTARE